MAEEYELYLAQRLLEDRTFEEGALYAGRNALIYNSVQEEGNIYTVLKNSSKKHVDNFEVIKGELYYFAQNDQEGKWAQEIGIKVSPYIIIDGELMSAKDNLGLKDEATGSIIIPQNVTKIGKGAFSQLQGLKKIVIPGTVKIIDVDAFRGNTTLEEVIIQEGVEVIEQEAFRDCPVLKNIELPTTITKLGDWLFADCVSITSINIPPSVSSIGSGLFHGCWSLESVVISDGITYISGSMFRNCSKLKQVEIPSTVQQIIAGDTFSGCVNLTDIDLINNEHFVYQNGILSDVGGTTIYFASDKILKSNTTFTIPEGIKTFNYNISGYNNIKKIVIPSSVNKIINSASFPTSLEEIEVKQGNETYISENSCLMSKDRKDLICCFSKEKEITLSEEIVNIGRAAFRTAQNLENIVLPEAVETIGLEAFAPLSKLKTLYLGKNVKNLSPVFMAENSSGNRTMADITISPQNPNYMINDNIIYSKDGKKIIIVLKYITGSYTVEDNVEVIGERAFANQRNLTEVILKNNVKEINDLAFSYSSKLKRVEIGSGIERISASAFTSSSSLSEIIIHKPKNSIANSPFGCMFGERAITWDSN